MSESFFGITHGIKLTRSQGERINTIARRHDAEFVWVRMPDGYRSWFTCDNLGETCVRAVKKAVVEDLQREQPGLCRLLGLTPTRTKIPVTTSGWYEHEDGTYGHYIWKGGIVHLLRTATAEERDREDAAEPYAAERETARKQWWSQ